MRKLLTGYAGGYNRRHRRHGHLFQNRYKSIVVDEDAYFKELVRYIHLNRDSECIPRCLRRGYPLVEAISQNVVKHPALPDAPSRAKLTERPSAKYTEKYADYIDLGVIEWRKAYAEHWKLGKKAILFVMTDDTRNCDDVAKYLEGHYQSVTASDRI
jgi:hypothetical protein